MGLHTLLHRRGAVYYFRQRIPLELIPCVGKKELRISLGTSNANEALKRLKLLSAKLVEQFDAVRAGNINVLQLDSPGQSHTRHYMAESASSQQSTGVPPVIRLSKVFDEWKQSHVVADNPKPAKTYGEWMLAVRQFTELNGDLPISAYTKEHVKRYKNVLAQLPKHLPASIREQSFAVIAEMARKGELVGDRLSPSTINKRLIALSSLFKYAEENDYVERSPVKGQLLPKTSHNREKPRIEYTPEDLTIIFHAPIYMGCHRYFRLRQGTEIIKDAMYWMPLLGLFTGAREDELLQLSPSDIHFEEEGKIWYIDINVEGGKKVKSSSAIRQIPIHNELIRCGFLDYIESMRAKYSKRIFPEIPLGVGGSFSEVFSKQYNRYVDKIGVTDKRKVYHSYRHGMTTKIAAIYPDNEGIQCRITGHTPARTSSIVIYGVRRLTTLNDIIQKVSFGVDLSHLHVDTKHPLNPSPATATPQQANIPVAEQKPPLNHMKCIWLPEAYNRIGKAWFKDKWHEYEYCIKLENKYWKYQHTKFSNTHKGKPEAKPIRVTTMHKPDLHLATEEEWDMHGQIYNYLSKVLGLEQVRKLVKIEGMTPKEMPQKFFETIKFYPHHIIESRVIDENTLYEVLIDPVSLGRVIQSDLS